MLIHKEVSAEIAFLTSSPGLKDGTLNPANGVVDALRAALPGPCRALFVCSDPDSFDRKDFYVGELRRSFERSGFRFSEYRVLDRRNPGAAKALLGKSDFVILAGGHVPTQNRFFAEIGLRALLARYGGALMGISAGTMNSAEEVYAQPELPGEAADPLYARFLPGLGLTETVIVPHYQDWKDDCLDGLRLVEDITLPDSAGRRFYLLPDGSYLYIRDGREELRGEAWRAEDGRLAQVSAEGGAIVP